MRQHKILTRTVFLLSIINFTLAVPVAVRGRPEVRLDGKVPRNVAAVSQERRGTILIQGLTNVPGPAHAPQPSHPLTNILSRTTYGGNAPGDSPSHPPLSPHSQLGPSAPPSSPLTDTPDSQGPPVAGSSSSPPPPLPHPSQPGESTGVDPVNSLSAAEFWSKVSKESRLLGSKLAPGSLLPPPPPLPRPSQPGGSTGVDPVNSLSAAEFWSKVSKESRLLGSKLAPGSLLPPPPPLHHPGAEDPWVPTGMPFPDESTPMAGSLPLPPPHPSPLGSSEGRFPSPSGSSANRPTGNQPTQSPGMDSETPFQPDPEPSLADFWENLMKGKISLRRDISGSDAVNLARRTKDFEISSPSSSCSDATRSSRLAPKLKEI